MDQNYKHIFLSSTPRNKLTFFVLSDYVGACFVGDIPLRYNVKFAFFDTDIVVNAIVMNFQPSVSSSAFELPSFCRRNLAAKPRSDSQQFNRALRSIFF